MAKRQEYVLKCQIPKVPVKRRAPYRVCYTLDNAVVCEWTVLAADAEDAAHKTLHESWLQGYTVLILAIERIGIYD